MTNLSCDFGADQTPGESKRGQGLPTWTGRNTRMATHLKQMRRNFTDLETSPSSKLSARETSESGGRRKLVSVLSYRYISRTACGKAVSNCQVYIVYFLIRHELLSSYILVMCVTLATYLHYLLLPTERKVQFIELYTEKTQHTVVHTHTSLQVSSFCP